MTFTLTRLSVLAYANGFTLWHYKAGEGGRRDVASRGFFDGAADMLALRRHADGLGGRRFGPDVRGRGGRGGGSSWSR